MRKTILETKRLILTSLQDSDIEALFQGCFSDWEVMKLLLGRVFTFEECKAYVEENFSKGELFNFTVAFDKNSNEIIGYGGIFPYLYNGKSNQYELGYILKQEAWGKGYATEMSIGQIEKLKKSIDNVSIWATAHPDNLASKRVLEKIGMKCVDSSVELPNRGLRDIYELKD